MIYRIRSKTEDAWVYCLILVNPVNPVYFGFELTVC